MKLSLLLGGLGLSMVLALAWALVPPKGNEAIERKIEERTVKIQVIPKNGFWMSQGTGTLIGHNYILTNSHLIDDRMGTPSMYTIMFRKYSGVAFMPAVIISSDTKKDFMLLKYIGKEDIPDLKFNADWHMEEPLVLIGNPIERDFVLGHSKLIAMSYIMNPMGYMRTMLFFPCGPGKPGFSGSGVWNMKGELLGIFELSTNIGVCAAIPTKDILQEKLDKPWEKK